MSVMSACVLVTVIPVTFEGRAEIGQRLASWLVPEEFFKCPTGMAFLHQQYAAYSHLTR